VKKVKDPNDGVCPFFSVGDWITCVRKHSKQYAPKGKHIWQVQENPVHVGYPGTGSGWKYRDVDATHFRKVTRRDVIAEYRRAQRRLERSKVHVDEVIELLSEMTRRGVT